MVAVLVDKSCVVADNVDPAVSVVGQVNEAVLIPVGACVKKNKQEKTFITNTERFCTQVASKQKNIYYKFGKILHVRCKQAKTFIRNTERFCTYVDFMRMTKKAVTYMKLCCSIFPGLTSNDSIEAIQDGRMG